MTGEEMKDKMLGAVRLLKEEMGADTTYLMIAHEGGKGSGAVSQNIDGIAQIIFSFLHTDEIIGPRLYKILRMLVLNIINNPNSPYNVDLIECILKNIPEDEE